GLGAPANRAPDPPRQGRLLMCRDEPVAAAYRRPLGDGTPTPSREGLVRDPAGRAHAAALRRCGPGARSGVQPSSSTGCERRRPPGVVPRGHGARPPAPALQPADRARLPLLDPTLLLLLRPPRSRPHGRSRDQRVPLTPGDRRSRHRLDPEPGVVRADL